MKLISVSPSLPFSPFLANGPSSPHLLHILLSEEASQPYLPPWSCQSSKKPLHLQRRRRKSSLPLYNIYIVRIYIYRWKEEKIRWNGRTTSEVGAGVEVSNPAGERLRTRVLHQSIIKAMSVLSSREKSFVPLFAAGASAAPRKIQFRARDEYAWNREIQQEWGRKYRYRFLMGRAKTRVRISDK